MPTRKHVQESVEYAQLLIHPFSHRGEPVDIEAVANSMGVDEVSAMEMNADGYLGRRSDGALVIRHRNGVGRARTRFTIAHEIAHIILSEVEGKPIAVNGVYRRDVGEEKAVNRIAAELLMPASLLVEDLCKQRTTVWDSVYRLSRQYRVSSSAMAFRLLELDALYAISLRINIDGMGPHSPYSYSEQHPIRLVNGIDFELDRIWREAKHTKRHTIVVSVNEDRFPIECEGDTHCFSTRLGDVETYWILGWSLAEH